jgi:sigma-B regulation protein RsbU (phosphoserine phosphatase)
VQLLARHRLTGTDSLAARLEALPVLTAVLSDHPEISAVYVGFASGDFFLVRPLRDGAVQERFGAPPETAFLVQSQAADDAVRGRYLAVDRDLAVLRDEPRPDYRFDPREREWYRHALLREAPVRTAPYAFFTTREIGTTLAQRSADGRSVVGVDITLQNLSRHLAQSRVTPSARMALVDGQGLVIAYPDAARLIRIAPGADPAVTRLTDLADPALGALFATPTRTSGSTALEVEGQPWIGMKRPIAADAGDPLLLLLAAPRAELVAEARGLARGQVLIGFGVLGIAVGLVWMAARRISRPLEDLSRSVQEIGRGNLDTALPAIWNPIEIGTLIEVTDRMRGQIKGHIEERAARLADEQRRIHELEIARQIQQSMLPSSLREPLDGQYAIAATLRPASEVGGDLYDFFLQDDHRLVFAIGDVADKGVPAALLMARVTGLLRVLGRAGTAPDAILRELDARLSEGNDACMFVTAACGRLDGENGELLYASAGHERPVLRRADGTTTVLTLEGGPALGLAMQSPFPLGAVRLAPGDALIVCTDGVTEAFDAGGTAFGLEGLRRVAADTPTDALGTLPERLVEALERFSAGGGPPDDLAVLAVQYWPPDVEVGLDGQCWRISTSPAPEDTARVQRRVEAILHARAVPPAMVSASSLAARDGLVTIDPSDGHREKPLWVEVRLVHEDIQIRVEDTGSRPPFTPHWKRPSGG